MNHCEEEEPPTTFVQRYREQYEKEVSTLTPNPDSQPLMVVRTRVSIQPLHVAMDQQKHCTNPDPNADPNALETLHYP